MKRITAFITGAALAVVGGVSLTKSEPVRAPTIAHEPVLSDALAVADTTSQCAVAARDFNATLSQADATADVYVVGCGGVF